MIQCNRFDDGTFVLHKIETNGKKYSAWYNKDGTAKDAELVFPNGNTRSVSARSRVVWDALNAIGARYVQ